MLARLAGLAARRPWPTVLIAVGAVAAMLAIGGPTAGSLSTGGFVDTQAENARAADLLQHAAGVGPAPAFVALVRADGGPRSPATPGASRRSRLSFGRTRPSPASRPSRTGAR